MNSIYLCLYDFIYFTQYITHSKTCIKEFSFLVFVLMQENLYMLALACNKFTISFSLSTLFSHFNYDERNNSN